MLPSPSFVTLLCKAYVWMHGSCVSNADEQSLVRVRILARGTSSDLLYICSSFLTPKINSDAAYDVKISLALTLSLGMHRCYMSYNVGMISWKL